MKIRISLFFFLDMRFFVCYNSVTEVKQMIEIELKQLIEERFGNVKAFSEKINLPYTTVRSILQRGILNSNVENVIIMSEGLGFRPEDLIKLKRKNILILDEKQTLIDNTVDIMEELEINQNKIIYEFAEKQLNSKNNIIQIPTSIVSGRSTAAGVPIDGESEDGNASTMIVDKMTIPKGADEIVTIAGDSMEPAYEEGSQVFIHWQPGVEQGEVAIVSIQDEGVTCKKVYYDWENGEIILRSINEKYEDKIYSMNDIRVIGKVL